MPYTFPTFLAAQPRREILNLSRIAHENSLEIFRIIEIEYNRLYSRKMTLMNLGQVITVPRAVDTGEGVSYDLTQSPSVYLANYLENLLRLSRMI